MWYIIILGLVGTFFVGLMVERKKPKEQKRANQYYRYVRILPHSSTAFNPEGILRLSEMFAGFQRTKKERARKGREWFRFMVYMGDKMEFYMGFPQDRQTGAYKAIKSLYPTCEIHEVAHKEVPFPKGTNAGYGGFFKFAKTGDQEGLPLSPFSGKSDQWADCLGFLEKDTWIDLVFSATSQVKLQRIVRRSHEHLHSPAAQKGNLKSGLDIASKIGKDFLNEFTSNGGKSKPEPKRAQPPKRELTPDEKVKVTSLAKRFTGRETPLEVSLSIWSEHEYAPSVVQAVANPIVQVMSYDQSLYFSTTKRCAIDRQAPLPSYTMIWTPEELANLFHLPDSNHQIYQNGTVAYLASGQRSLAKNELDKGISLGNLQHPLHGERSVRVPVSTLLRHYVLSGKTGAGKSSILVEMIDSLIYEWLDNPNVAPGFSFIDPAGSTITIIMNRLLKAELEGKKVPWEKVHYAYMGPTDYPVGLNLLHYEKGEPIGEVADTVLNLLKHAYAGSTPRLDNYVKNGIMTLLADRNQHTILGLLPLLSDENFRDRIVPYVTDDIIKGFWRKELDVNALAPIENRLSPLITNPTMRRMFGQREWKVPLRKYMDEGHILLWDLLGVSQSNLRLTMGHLTNQYHVVAKGRPEDVSRPHLLKIDEAHEAQLPILPKIIFEDRKFGLSLGLISQFIDQFNPALVDAISEVAGTVISCTLGDKSAAKVSRMTNEKFSPSYLKGLGERVAAVYTQIDIGGRKETTTFTVNAPPPVIYLPNGKVANYENKDEMKQAQDWARQKSRELQQRDWVHADEVDEEISEYLRTGTVRQIAKKAEAAAKLESSHSSPAPRLKKPPQLKKPMPESVATDKTAAIQEPELPVVNDDDDELYSSAVEIVLSRNEASVSLLQRNLRIGYTRAARLMAMMEDQGVVGPYQGSQPREIFGVPPSSPSPTPETPTKKSTRLLIPKE